jgi:hypothetical protein
MYVYVYVCVSVCVCVCVKLARIPTLALAGEAPCTYPVMGVFATLAHVVHEHHDVGTGSVGNMAGGERLVFHVNGLDTQIISGDVLPNKTMQTCCTLRDSRESTFNSLTQEYNHNC